MSDERDEARPTARAPKPTRAGRPSPPPSPSTLPTLPEVEPPTRAHGRSGGERREPGRFPEHERYAFRERIGQGGQGMVFRVFDAELDREVALKTLLPEACEPELAAAFVEEARATARLGHPNIIPIFDVGLLPDERPYYTMQLVPGRSLRDVLHERERARARAQRRPEGEDEGASSTGGAEEESWSLPRLVQVVQQVCNALELAHQRGVLHRDVKPANIMLGPFGEVLLVDWGIAKGSGTRARAGRGRLFPELVARETELGMIKGTVAYMSPEALRGGRRCPGADVYAVGVVLHEILTGRRPFDAPTNQELIDRILSEPLRPLQEVDPERHVPEALGRIVLRALARNPTERLGSAGALGRELQAYLEDKADREKRRVAAELIREEAEAALQRHRDAKAEAGILERELARLEEVHPPWQPIEAKAPLLLARKRSDELSELTWTSFLDGVHRLTDALAHVPEHAGVRRTLAGLFWPRFLEAEECQQRLLAVTYRKLVERFHDGVYSEELDGSAGLHLEVWPKEARLELHEQVEEGLVLVDGPPRDLGTGDVTVGRLAMGSYVIVARAPGHVTSRYPVCIERSRDWRGELRLPRQGTIPDGFVHVPGCEALLGGDERASNSWPLRRMRVESFAMARFPVTFGEYCEFLDDVADRAEAEDLVPRTSQGELCGQDAAGTWRPLHGLPLTDYLKSHGAGVRSRLPVIGVDRSCTSAFAAWRSARLGKTLRLPTGAEWELAARGADRRPYPWGWRMDPALCHVRQSLEAEPDLAPVGTFAADESLHGVRDLAGCVREWTMSPFEAGPAFSEVRGSCWSSLPLPAAFRGRATNDAREAELGFRLVADVID